ncbi:MAG: hypothetical protein ACTHVP_08165 [Alkalibacterium gilvum]
MSLKKIFISGTLALTLGSLSFLLDDNDVPASGVKVIPSSDLVQNVDSTSVVQINDDLSDDSNLSYYPESEVWFEGEYLGKVVVEEEDMVMTPSFTFYKHSSPLRNKS